MIDMKEELPVPNDANLSHPIIDATPADPIDIIEKAPEDEVPQPISRSVSELSASSLSPSKPSRVKGLLTRISMRKKSFQQNPENSAAIAASTTAATTAIATAVTMPPTIQVEVPLDPELILKPDDIQGLPINRVRAASIRGLVSHVISRENVDPDLMPAIALSWKRLCNPDAGMLVLVRVFNELTAKLTVDGTQDIQVLRSLIRFVECQKSFLRVFWGSLHQSHMDEVQNMVYRLINVGILELAQQLRLFLISPIKRTSKSLFFPCSVEIDSRLVKNLIDLSPATIAEQLTLLDAAWFAVIQPSEVFDWAFKQSKETSPGVFDMIAHFNAVSMWCSSAILTQTDLNDRVDVLKKFADVAKWLAKMSNFNSLMALLSGINRSSVHRLSLTKEAAGSKCISTIEKLLTLMSHEQSFSSYRTALKEAPLPCLPYLGVFLTDLTFIHQGNKDCVPSEVDSSVQLLNFSKVFS